MLVEEVMEDPYVIEKDIKMSEAAKLMSENNTDCLIFFLKEDIKGIITERDILKNFKKNKKVSQIMTKDVIIIESDKDLSDALRLMQENKIKRLPVVKEGKLIGIISATDLLANSDELDEDYFF